MSPSIQNVINIIILALNFPRKTNDFIIFAESILTKIRKNSRYSALSPILDELAAAIKELYDEQSLCNAKPRTGNTNTRDIYLFNVKVILKKLGSKVQQMADADLPNAATIITDAGFKVKQTTGGHHNKNSVKDGPQPGSFVGTSSGKGARNWRVSLDNKNFVLHLASKTPLTTIYNYESGDIVYVQSALVLYNGAEGHWSQSIKFRLK